MEKDILFQLKNLFASEKEKSEWYFIEVCWTYILPLICLFGLITNLLNMIVFVSISKLKETLYKYMLINSIVDFFYLIILSFISLSKCGSLCGMIGNSYLAKFYELYLFFYLSNVLCVFNSLIEICFTLNRYLAISDLKHKCKFEKLSFGVIVFMLFVVSSVWYLPILFTKNIEYITISNSRETALNKPILDLIESKLNRTILEEYANKSIYFLGRTKFGMSDFGKVMVMLVAFIRCVGIFLAIFVLNALTAYKFREFILKKCKIKRENNLKGNF